MSVPGFLVAFSTSHACSKIMMRQAVLGSLFGAVIIVAVIVYLCKRNKYETNTKAAGLPIIVREDSALPFQLAAGGGTGAGSKQVDTHKAGGSSSSMVHTAVMLGGTSGHILQAPACMHVALSLVRTDNQ